MKLYKEISRVTKYFLDRGISMHCKLTSRHYRRSPLVQGGLEIKCEMVINSRATVLQSRLTSRYPELIQNLYTEPVEERVMRELVFNFVMTLPPMLNMPVLTTLKKRKRKLPRAMPQPEIRETLVKYFLVARRARRQMII